jgi:hypothetical protein
LNCKNLVKQSASAVRWDKAPDRPFPAEALVDAEFLPALVRYTWRKNTNGYYYTRVAKKAISLHRFVWRLQFGSLPPELDHINRNRVDCRIENLRPATRSMNTSGVVRPGRALPRGVSFRKDANLYEARFRNVRLGYFRDAQAASVVYERALESHIQSEASRAS